MRHNLGHSIGHVTHLTLYLASFYDSHIDGIVCVCEKDCLGVRKDIKKVLKISSDFNFTVTSSFLGNIRLKPYFKTQWGRGVR